MFFIGKDSFMEVYQDISFEIDVSAVIDSPPTPLSLNPANTALRTVLPDTIIEFKDTDPIDDVIDSILLEQSLGQHNPDTYPNGSDFLESDVDPGTYSLLVSVPKSAAGDVIDIGSGKELSEPDAMDTPTIPEDVIVTGRRVTYGGGGSGVSGGFLGGGGGIYTHEDPAIYNPSTGTGEEYYLRYFALSQIPDQTIDALALEIRDLIKDQPDVKNREYGAVLYLNSTTGLLEAYLVKGEASSGNRPARVNFASSIREIADIAGGKQFIIGLIHSHPDNNYTYNPAEQRELSDGDVIAAQGLRDYLGSIGYAPIMRQYIIGQDDNLYEHSLFAAEGSRGVRVGE
jgi:hypothetical protein